MLNVGTDVNHFLSPDPRSGVARKYAYLISIFCVAMPFTSAFAVHAWLPLNLAVLLVIISMDVWTRPRWRWEAVHITEWLFVVSILAGLVAIFFAPDTGTRTRNHALAITVAACLFYVYVRVALIPNASIAVIARALWLSLCISSVFVVSEFILSNYLGIALRDYVPYLEIRTAEEVHYDSTMLGIWVRPRGLAIEAGHMAAFYELALPLAWLYIRERRSVWRLLMYFFCCAAFLLLGSAAATSALACSVLVVLLWRGVEFRTRVSVILVLVTAVVLVATQEEIRYAADELIIDKTLGFFGIKQTDNFSAMDRAARAGMAVGIVRKYPFGFGWGTAAHMSQTGGDGDVEIPFGFISLYAEFLAAGGILGLITYAAFVVFTLGRLLRQSGSVAAVIFVAAFSLSIHYGTMSNYWHPFLWFSYAMCNWVSICHSSARLPPRRINRAPRYRPTRPPPLCSDSVQP